MARVCQVTGKKPVTGNKVSHSNIKTKRRFLPNLQTKRYFLAEEDKWVTLKVSAEAIRTINKNGLYLECESAEVKQWIIEELEQVKQKELDSDMKKGVVPKDKVKELLGRSPDFADTIMMREYFDLKPSIKFAGADY